MTTTHLPTEPSVAIAADDFDLSLLTASTSTSLLHASRYLTAGRDVALVTYRDETARACLTQVAVIDVADAPVVFTLAKANTTVAKKVLAQHQGASDMVAAYLAGEPIGDRAGGDAVEAVFETALLMSASR